MIFDELNWNYRLMYWTYYLMKILRLPLTDWNHLKLKNCFCKIKQIIF